MGTSTFFPAFILLSFLSGCVAASEILSGSGPADEGFSSSSILEDVHTGISSKEELQNLLGTPTHVQVSTPGTHARESWAYVPDTIAAQPFQYLPFLGGFVMTSHRYRHPFSVSFSPEGIVDGVTLSPVHTNGHKINDLATMATRTNRPLYGMKNPLVQPSIH